jgi:D-sedoheptulose 7-phosphate isomerase
MLKKIIADYSADFKEAIDRLPFAELEEIIDIIWSAYVQERNIFIMGNGGSAATASHFACDLNKGVSLGLRKRFKAICLNDNVPIMLAYANDVSYDEVFVGQLRNFLKPNDVIIGISGSGNSKNVLKAIQYGNTARAITIGFTGFKGGQLGKIAKHKVIIDSNDLQKIEDAHLVLCHIIMQLFCKRTVK